MADDKRKLTEKELKRKNDFEKISSEMYQKGYKIKNMTGISSKLFSLKYQTHCQAMLFKYRHCHRTIFIDLYSKYLFEF